MVFKMKVDELFRIEGKTIFAGNLESNEGKIANVECMLVIDGKDFTKVHIDGEVASSRGFRDLWTGSPVKIDREIILTHDVWLVSR